MTLFIDADNAMGSPSGDVDDGFAVAALLLSGMPIAGLASVRGNTSEARAHANNRRLADLCHYSGPVLRGARESGIPGEASGFLLSPGPLVRFLAFGPLTNLAEAVRCDADQVAARVGEVVIVGGNATSAGRWPPLWPHEFNLTKDLDSTRTVFESELPLTFATLDLLENMTVSKRDVEALRGTLGEYLRGNSRRWLLRARLLKWSRTFPLWDLVAAMYVIGEPSIRTERTFAKMHRNGWIQFGTGDRKITLLREFDRDALWTRFIQQIEAAWGRSGG